jgi:hypothetical protein
MLLLMEWDWWGRTTSRSDDEEDVEGEGDNAIW